jgi:hypothetical protein
MAKDTQKQSKIKPSDSKKRSTAAKQSAKRKQKQALKYHNADLRAALDSQTQVIFAVGILNLCSADFSLKRM